MRSRSLVAVVTAVLAVACEGTIGGAAPGGGASTGGGSATGGGGGGAATGGGASNGGGSATGGGAATGGGSASGGGSVTGGGAATGGGNAGSTIALRFFNVVTQQVDPRFVTLPSSLPLPQVLPVVTLLAEVTPAAASVRFTVDGVSRVDGAAPFRFSEAADGTAAAWTAAAGAHSIEVLAYASADGSGAPMGQLSTTLTLTTAGTDLTPNSGAHTVYKLWRTESGKWVSRAANGDFVDPTGAVVLAANQVTAVDLGGSEVHLVSNSGVAEKLAFAFIVALPDGFDAAVPYPLFVFLHHGGGDYRGTDNDGTPLDAPPLAGPVSLRSSAQRLRFPAILLVPQMPHVEQVGNVTNEWAAFTTIDGTTGNATSAPAFSTNAQPVLDVIDALLARQLKVGGGLPTIDPKRLYLSGHSMGGLGTWDWVERRPQFFAGAVPMAGYPDFSRAAAVKDTPIWAFHHQIDCYNAFAGSNTMFQRVTQAPNNGKVMKLTKLTFDTGGACDQAHFQTPDKAWNETPGVLEWLFSQVAP